MGMCQLSEVEPVAHLHFKARRQCMTIDTDQLPTCFGKQIVSEFTHCGLRRTGVGVFSEFALNHRVVDNFVRPGNIESTAVFAFLLHATQATTLFGQLPAQHTMNLQP